MALLCINTVALTGTNAPVRELGAGERLRRPPAAGNPPAVGAVHASN